MHKTLFSFLLFLFLYSGTKLFGQDATIPAEVHEVKSFGQWETADRYGHFRIVIKNRGHEHVASKVYLEWLSEGKDMPEVVMSVPITEINKERLYAVGVEKTDIDKVTLSLTHTYSLENSLLEITPTEMGEYKANTV